MAPRPPLPLLLAVGAAVLLALTHTGEVRARAEAALGRGVPAREAELARGFVLGQDDRIDERTVEDFRRSGLAHLLAVSGQNVALLALLAMPLLAALGMPLRTRLVWVIGLIAVYVPLAGAGPSIQRAGAMGALSLVAMLAGRRASRLYALALAAAVTLAIDPGIAADVGWQLSFAAVLGILVWAGPLRAAIATRIGGSGLAGALADGAAMTVAATLSTAPLIAFHFEGFSTATLLANLLVLPAVAPAMWLGMLIAAAGQVPGFPVELLGAVNAPLLAYVAQVATWFGRPEWAYLEVQLGLGGLLAVYLALAAATLLLPRLLRHRRLAGLRRKPTADGPRTRPHQSSPARRRWGWLLVGLVFAWFAMGGGGGEGRRPPIGLRVSVIDVGQGDAILLQPRRATPVLVDTGPPGAGLVGKLRVAGVERLGAVVVTHDQSDHAGGVEELLDTLPVERLYLGPTRRLAQGDVLRSGGLTLEVLWPPAELLGGPLADEDLNRLSLVMLARWRDFSLLLTGDAEAEAVPLDPGPIDVLKLAHHGSEDTGLTDLLARTQPDLAVISVGAGNPHGHPAPSTLQALASHGVRVLRTDLDGTIVIEADP